VKITVEKSKVKNGRNRADYSKEGYGSKRAVLPMMMMMMMMNRTPPSAKAKNEEVIPQIPHLSSYHSA
jgi:hypothetical protein